MALVDIPTVYELAYRRLRPVSEDIITTLKPGELERLAEARGSTAFEIAYALRLVAAHVSKRTLQEQVAFAHQVRPVPPTPTDLDHLDKRGLGDLARAALAEGADVSAYIAAAMLPERYRHAERAGRHQDFGRKILLTAAYIEQLSKGLRPGAAAGAALKRLGIRHSGRDACQKALKVFVPMMIGACQKAGTTREHAEDATASLLAAALKAIEEAAAEVDQFRRGYCAPKRPHH